MHPGHWRNPERDSDLHTTLRLVNGLLALTNVILVGWIIYCVASWAAQLFT